MLYGRAREVAAIDRVLDRVRAGAGGGVLILRGEAGIGKTALLDHAEAQAAGLRVLRGGGVEAEAGVPFAALHLLFGGIPGGVDELPAAQAAALRAALGLARPRPEDRLLVGLAVLSLLARPDETPLVCLIDDAQWLDQESADALFFAARRTASRPIVFLIATRDDRSRTGLPELRLDGLDDDDARRLLDDLGADREHSTDREHSHDRELSDGLVREARGNPLALAAFAEAGSGRLARVPAEFGRAVRELDEPVRLLLAAVAADETGEPGVVVRAARDLGVPLDALEAAEESGLVSVTRTSIGFRHPLARAAAYQGVPVTRRIAVHRALAAVHARAGDADLRVRHLAAAALGTDETVAAELESAADDIGHDGIGHDGAGHDGIGHDGAGHHGAGHHGGPAVAAFAYERAARLAGEPAVRARRLAAAAEAELAAGNPEKARTLADEAARSGDAETRARAELVRAGVEAEHGVPEAAARLLMERARDHSEPEIRTRLLEEAVLHAWACGDRDTAVRARELLAGIAGPTNGLAEALGALLDDDVAEARRVLAGLPQDGTAGDERLHLLAAEVALLAGDDDAAAEASARLVARCRERGTPGPVPRGLAVQAWARLFHGAHDEARALARDAIEAAEAAGQRQQAAARRQQAAGRIVQAQASQAQASQARASQAQASQARAVQARQAAMEGDEVRCRALSADGGGGVGDALGLLALGLGRPEDALEHLRDARPDTPGPPGVLALADTVEAAVAAGRPTAGADAMARLEAFARDAGHAWADGVASRCRALLTADPAEAERHFDLALAAHREGGRPFERARTELLYGEWLRRSRRRAQARARLKAALEIFERLGAVPWAERARGELRAAGQGVRTSGSDDVPGRLTAQEMQVVRLAMTGATNRQIAARLRLSHRTVAYHLYKAFPKLGVASRAELHRHVPAEVPVGTASGPVGTASGPVGTASGPLGTASGRVRTASVPVGSASAGRAGADRTA
ncbi:helix-turn-helix transcriptional regulator [Actinomadura decatromicini]|uniref:helix-turn-helix transcriptional regulator n=1 Tax=Actinomadura decatromicini TaxID=2604572 RepID=UPI0016533D60|nr:helix-turn-helix transcriptional regulator [Actinomadura decatromicini]